MYKQLTKHPKTGHFELALWYDGLVRFKDKSIFNETDIDAIEINGVYAEVDQEFVEVRHWDKSEEIRKNG